MQLGIGEREFDISGHLESFAHCVIVFCSQAKDSDNPENSYNQNFDGVYCTCSRPYPDPENDVSDDMMQCVMCEDWYHSKVIAVCPIEKNKNIVSMF